MTPEEYLEFDRQSDTKHEYFGGEIYAMAGAKRRHVWITTRIVSLLSSQIGVGPCDVLSSDMRVQVSDDAYYYPDVVVVCDDYQYAEGDAEDTLLNPNVIIEVLSKSTKDRDRGSKWQQYRQIDSLQDYLLVSQDQMLVEHYTRDGDAWVLRDYVNEYDSVPLPSVGCELKLSEIYQKIDFGQPEEEDTSE
jgi:Uma2 family endonuclease